MPSEHARPPALAALRYLLFLAPLAAALACAARLGGTDQAVYELFSAHRAAHPGLHAAMRLVTDWGNAVFYLVYAAILLKGVQSGNKGLVRLALVYAAVQILISLLIVRGLKIAIGRPRPDVGGLFAPGSLSSSYHSLPSGHTTEIVGAALPLALRTRRWWPALALGLYAGLVGFSRVYLGMHHVSDVLLGAALGSVAGWAIAVFARPSGRTPA